jgi:hypothetical protein
MILTPINFQNYSRLPLSSKTTIGQSKKVLEMLRARFLWWPALQPARSIAVVIARARLRPVLVLVPGDRRASAGAPRLFPRLAAGRRLCRVRRPLRGEEGPVGVVEVACWAHARRKFYDIHQATRSPMAEDLLKRIATLYDVENEVRGLPAERRRLIRQEKAAPLIDELAAVLDAMLPKLPGKSELAAAIRYARNH